MLDAQLNIERIRKQINLESLNLVDHKDGLLRSVQGRLPELGPASKKHVSVAIVGVPDAAKAQVLGGDAAHIRHETEHRGRVGLKGG